MPEDENSQASKQTVHKLLTEVKSRALELAKNDPQLIKKVFSDFDLN